MVEYVGPYGELIETSVRVATWNLWWRFGPWKERQPAIAATLERLDADIICLQEVWEVDGGNQAAGFAEQLGYHHVFSNRFEEGEKFGNAILSRWPITRTESRPLPAPGDAEEFRTVAFAEVEGPRGPIQVFCTHLNWRHDHSAIRQDQLRTIARFVTETRPRTYPPVLCGDMNADPTSDEIRMLTGRAPVAAEKAVFLDAWEVAGEGLGHTWSNANPYAALDLEPPRRIDYVFYGWPKQGGAGHAVRCEVIGTDPVDGVVPSDHYGVLAELRY
jgi:endonuclease/exonuclease/phosphatase family metal-dependent hydrolase